jgi:hypothetical protein
MNFAKEEVSKDAAWIKEASTAKIEFALNKYRESCADMKRQLNEARMDMIKRRDEAKYNLI